MNKETGRLDTIEEFAQEVAKNIKNHLPGEYQDAECEVTKKLKNNGVYMTGVLIRKKEDRMPPVVYMEPYFNIYRHGAALDETMAEIASAATSLPPFGEKDVRTVKNFEDVKDWVCPVLVNTKANFGMLQDVPHLKVEEMSLYCQIRLPVEEGASSIKVTESFLRMWGITKEQLFKQMFENTKKPGEWELKELWAFLGEIGGKGEALNLLEAPDDYFKGRSKGDRFTDALKMYVLSNKSKMYGAAAFVCPYVMEKVGRLFSGGVYILPSSIHEVMIVEKSEWANPGGLKEMLCEVNWTQIGAAERLSDHVYEYDREHGKIRLAVGLSEKEKGMER